jgi:lysophospholipase L1-like esterase
MMRARLVTPVVLATLVATSAAAQWQPATRAASPGMYIALGDSVPAGIGSSLPRAHAYPTLVHRWLERHSAASVPFSNLAVPGETSATFLANGQLERFRVQLERAASGGIPVAAVTLTLGGNEMLDVQTNGVSDRQAALDAFQAEYATAVGALRQALGPETPLVVTTYYDPTAGDDTLQFTDSWWVVQFNAVIREVAQANAALVADIHAGFRDNAARYTHYPLDVHPSNAGHAAYARLVWAALGVDATAPVITRLSRTMATRTTPTLRFSLSETTTIEDIVVSVEPGVAGTPLAVGGDEYVVLLDFAGVDAEAATAHISATDAAGNRSELAIDLTLAFGAPADTGGGP